jgi:hypothetical protein
VRPHHIDFHARVELGQVVTLPIPQTADSIECPPQLYQVPSSSVDWFGTAWARTGAGANSWGGRGWTERSEAAKQRSGAKEAPVSAHDAWKAFSAWGALVRGFTPFGRSSPGHPKTTEDNQK